MLLAKWRGCPGVSIRTLHHYDAIGLLKPASVGENGYRQYGREELLRLQQILFHRELGMSLADIAAALDAPNFDGSRRYGASASGWSPRRTAIAGLSTRSTARSLNWKDTRQ